MEAPSFTVDLGGRTRRVTGDDLVQFADWTHLGTIAPGRVSWLLVLGALIYHQESGIDPSEISREIVALENGVVDGTKPASRFLPLHSVASGTNISFLRGSSRKICSMNYDPPSHSSECSSRPSGQLERLAPRKAFASWRTLRHSVHSKSEKVLTS